jgi:DnaJ-class molecular chaperone
MATPNYSIDPCPKCKGIGHDYTQKYQSLHGCFAHHNSAVCWACKGTGSAMTAYIVKTAQS